MHDWSTILAKNVKNVYNEFLEIIKEYLKCVPVKTIRIGRKDPDFIAPYIKCLLNKLRRQGKVELAD